MKYNILKPRESVQSCIDRPYPRTAFLLVIIPTILATVGYFLFGFAIQPLQIGLSLVRSIINWALLSLAIYLVLYLAKGKELRGKFAGIASAVSLVWIINLILIVLGFLFVPLVFSSAILEQGKLLASGQIQPENFLVETGSIIDQNPESVHLEFGILAMAIGVLLVVFAVYLIYLLVSDLYRGKILPNLIITLIALIAWLFITSWVWQWVSVSA